jgi:outer membrane lipoprotein carrier protein
VALGCRLLVGLVLTGAAHGGSIDRLKNFMRDAHSLRAEFEQSVYGTPDKPAAASRGKMQMERPGKFRWEYTQPFKQLIVGDGEKVWIWDPDLNQVTVRKMRVALGSSPAALLAGNNEIEKNFNLKDAGSRDGMEWLDAAPKGGEGNIESVRLAFKGNSLARMELKDSFGQVTVIRFSSVQKNPLLGEDLFRFTPPRGADVLEE